MNYRCILIVAVFAAFSSAYRFSAAEKSKAEQRTYPGAEPKTEQKSGTKPKSEALFKRLDLSSSSSFRFDTADFAQTSADTTCGIRARFRDADLRFYEALTDIALPNFGGVSVCSPQYGAALSLTRVLPFPLAVKVGTLSPGGSFSRLVIPAPSFSAFPFAKSFPTKTGLSSLLPSSPTGNKPLAVAADCRLPDALPRFAGSGASFLYREDGTLAASADIRINLPRMMSAGLSFTGASFFLENDSSSWFSEIAFFKPARYSAYAVQALFSAPNITSLFTANFYDQPSGKLRSTYRSENVFSVGGFTLFASAFASDGRGIITSNGSALHTLRQFRVAPQYTYRFPSLRLPSLTVGAAGTVRQTYVPFRDGERTSVKCGGGVQYSDKYISSRLVFEIGGIDFSSEQGVDADTVRYAISENFFRRKGKLRYGALASYTFSKKAAEESCKFSLMHSQKNITSSGSAGFSFKQKNGEYGGGAASLGFSVSHTTKFIKYTFRLSAVGKY
ncbi:hypothetical protein [Treponema socranskii]|uniref:hypothetical protein n=1 Tax=Treponema socranskii TaxID=53419 RepID=UPI003D89DB66